MEMQFSLGSAQTFDFSLGGGTTVLMPIVEMTQAEYDALETYDANTLYAIVEGTAYDETKIAIIELDENDEPTGNVDYVDTSQELATFLAQTTTNYPYEIRIGSETGITKLTTDTYGDSYFFARNTHLVSIVFPGSVTEIGSYTFQNCTNLKNVEIADSGLQIIWTGAFEGCTSLKEITIPSTVTNIVNYAFRGTSDITITINKAQGSISGSPWGATNATVVWTGGDA